MSERDATSAPSTWEERRETLRQLSGLIGTLGTGPLAELRRASADDPPVPAFWRAMLRFPSLLEAAGPTQDERERRWIALLSARAMLDGIAWGSSLGRSLAAAGLSELRLSRFLRAKDDALLVQVREIARFLAVKAQDTNWIELVDLVLSQDQPSWAESVRRRVSRDYFRAVESQS